MKIFVAMLSVLALSVPTLSFACADGQCKNKKQAKGEKHQCSEADLHEHAENAQASVKNLAQAIAKKAQSTGAESEKEVQAQVDEALTRFREAMHNLEATSKAKSKTALADARIEMAHGLQELSNAINALAKNVADDTATTGTAKK